jgi:hypothetical protein
MHRILLEEDYKPSIEHQRRLNPNMKEVLKLLDAGVIYPIFDSKWVTPVQVVPKKGGLTVIKNDKSELSLKLGKVSLYGKRRNCPRALGL